MGSREYVANEAEVPRGTLCELFLGAVDRFGDAPALRSFVGDSDRMRDLSYREALETARAVAGGLDAMGLEAGGRVALLSENRPEWALADYGCLLGGFIDVPIHSTLVAHQVAYILRDSGASVVFASDRGQMEKALEAGREMGQEVRVVVFDDPGGAPDGVQSWDRFLAAGRERMEGVDDGEFRNRATRARPEDLATILYTSGTTGDPKGVLLTHDNLFSNVEASALALPVEPHDVTLTFLPLSHVLQRMVDYLLLSRGCTLAYAHSMEALAADLKVVQPTVEVAVPRVYEKVYAAAMEVGGAKGWLVRWAREVGLAWAREVLAGRRPTLPLRVAHGAADRIVYEKIRAAVGGRVRWFVSGSAPLQTEIAEFFYAAGMPILEGYGLTETSPVTNVNTPEDIRIGTVGKPVASTEIRIAEDGEILIRGRQVMKGYYNLPEETAKAIDDEGWFRSGDIGEIDADGFLTITDRKKDLIKTSGGKYVAPQPIEARVKDSRFVEQVVLIGDRRKFASLLVVPAFGALEGWAREKGIPAPDREALLEDDEVQSLYVDEVLKPLGDLARHERPKKVALLGREFTIEEGTLTPTQKVKRRVVQDRYARLIDRLYAPESEDQDVLVVRAEEIT